MRSSTLLRRMTRLQLCDVGANMTDPIFRGVYRGKKVHEDDFEKVLERAFAAGVERMLVTGGDLEESRRAMALAKLHRMLSLYPLFLIFASWQIMVYLRCSVSCLLFASKTFALVEHSNWKIMTGTAYLRS